MSDDPVPSHLTKDIELLRRHLAVGLVTLEQIPEYKAWCNMRTRCANPNNKRWHRYGGRGIKVCEEWQTDFWAFLAHVGLKPSPDHSIDRYPDRDGNYEPGNVRWATQADQTNNRTEPVASGELNGHAKLTWEWVREIRFRYAKGDVSQRTLADEFGTTHANIGSIVRNETWIEEPTPTTDGD
jgi:hypothetical protein